MQLYAVIHCYIEIAGARHIWSLWNFSCLLLYYNFSSVASAH